MLERPRSLRLAAGLFAGLLLPVSATVAAPPAAQAAPGDADDDEPALAITIDNLEPGVLPRQGPVAITGTVTNNDDEDWTGINLYPYLNTDDCRADATCGGPMTTVEELVEAAATAPETPVGERLTDLDVSETIESLAPGGTATFTLTVPQRVLREEIASPEAGVYWFGVQALGSSASAPRDLVADGRARTFLPYVPEGKAAPTGSVDAAVVVPIRAPITHRADGALTRIKRWRQRLDSDGRLTRLLDFGEAADGRPVSWLVDPAVLDAVRNLASGNPARELLPQVEGDEVGGESESPTDEASEQPSDAGGIESEPRRDPLAGSQAWLDRAQSLLAGNEVLGLPYGDPDLSGAGSAAEELYATARTQQGQVLAGWETTVTPAVSGADGYLDPEVLDDFADEPVVMLTDRMFGQEDYPDGPPATAEVDGNGVAVTSSGASSGGPGPNPTLTAVALRQRLLGEAAVRLIADDTDPDPVVLEVPTGVVASDADDFWEGLDQPWLNLTGVGPILAGDRTTITTDSLTYPDQQDDQEQAPALFGEALRLMDAGRSLQSILGEESSVGGEVTREALVGTSFALRGDSRATTRLAVSRAWVERRLSAVEISAPPGVTLSSSTGRFSVTVSNDLDYPVRVQVTAEADEGTTITESEPILLAPASSTSVSLEAHTTRPGVHDVRLRVTDIDGVPLGSSDTVPVRSGQVSIVIWGIIGAGVAILFLAIAIRLVKRIRRARHNRRRADQDGADQDGAHRDEADRHGADS